MSTSTDVLRVPFALHRIAKDEWMLRELSAVYHHVVSYVVERQHGRVIDKLPRLLTPVTYTKWAVSYKRPNGSQGTLYIYHDKQGWRY